MLQIVYYYFQALSYIHNQNKDTKSSTYFVTERQDSALGWTAAVLVDLPGCPVQGRLWLEILGPQVMWVLDWLVIQMGVHPEMSQVHLYPEVQEHQVDPSEKNRIQSMAYWDYSEAKVDNFNMFRIITCNWHDGGKQIYWLSKILYCKPLNFGKHMQTSWVVQKQLLP